MGKKYVLDNPGACGMQKDKESILGGLQWYFLFFFF